MVPERFSGEPELPAHLVQAKCLPTSDFTLHALVVDTIYHRAAQTPEILNPNSAVQTRLTYSMQQMLQQLNKWIASDDTRTADETLFAVWMMARVMVMRHH